MKIKWCRDISIISSYDDKKEKELLEIIKNNYDYEFDEENHTINLLYSDKNINFIKDIIAPRVISELTDINILFVNNKGYITDISFVNREIKEYENI